MLRKLKNIIQTFVIVTKDLPILKNAYRILYKVSIKIIVQCIKTFPEIKSIFLRGSMATGEFIPGLSDIDLLIILRKVPADKKLTFINAFWKRYFLLKMIFPYLGHIEIFEEGEINDFLLFSVFVNTSKFYKNLSALKELYGDFGIKREGLDRLVKEIPVNLLKFVLLLDDYLKLLAGFYKLNYSIHPNIYLASLYRILSDRLPEKITLTSHLTKDFIANSFYDAIESINKSCQVYIEHKEAYHEMPLRISEYNFKPQTHSYVVKMIEPFIESLHKEIGGYVESIILSSEIGSNYSYHIFIGLKENQNRYVFKKFLIGMQSVYMNLRNPAKEYFFMRQDKPIILKSKIMEAFPYTNSHMGYFYLTKHATILKGKDNLINMPRVNSVSWLNIGLFVSEMKCALNCMPSGNIQICDIAYGMLPAIRLMVDKSILPITPEEVFLEYYKNYSHEKETMAIEANYKKSFKCTEKLPGICYSDFKQAYIFGKYCLAAIDKFFK